MQNPANFLFQKNKAKTELTNPNSNRRKLSNSVITSMFKSAGGPGISDHEKFLLTEALIHIIVLLNRALDLGEKAMIPYIDLADPDTTVPCYLSLTKYKRNVLIWFLQGTGKHEIVQRGLLKLYNVLTDPDQLITFLDVRLSDTPSYYHETDISGEEINSTELPNYEQSEKALIYDNKAQPPSYSHALCHTKVILPDSASASASASASGGSKITNPLKTNIVSTMKDPIEVFSVPWRCRHSFNSGLCVYVTGAMLHTDTTKKAKTRFIAHDVACKLLSLECYENAGVLAGPEDELDFNGIEPTRTLDLGICWAFFLTCFG